MIIEKTWSSSFGDAMLRRTIRSSELQDTMLYEALTLLLTRQELDSLVPNHSVELTVTLRVKDSNQSTGDSHEEEERIKWSYGVGPNSLSSGEN